MIINVLRGVKEARSKLLRNLCTVAHNLFTEVGDRSREEIAGSEPNGHNRLKEEET